MCNAQSQLIIRLAVENSRSGGSIRTSTQQKMKFGES